MTDLLQSIAILALAVGCIFLARGIGHLAKAQRAQAESQRLLAEAVQRDLAMRRPWRRPELESNRLHGDG